MVVYLILRIYIDEHHPKVMAQVGVEPKTFEYEPNDSANVLARRSNQLSYSALVRLAGRVFYDHEITPWQLTIIGHN